MRILLTGTGAADGIPGYFQTDRVSELARAHGGKDVRYRSGAVVDGVLKIDWGPDTFACAQRLGLRPRDWTHVLFTHSHDDHYAPREFQYLFPPFLPMETERPLIYGNAAVVDGFAGQFEEASLLERFLIRSFEPVEVAGYRVTPIHAYHKLDEDSLNLILEKDGKRFLYGTDTGVYQDDTWEFLEGVALDGIVLDCTDGFQATEYWGHLSCEELLRVVDRLAKIGCVGSETFVGTTHHGALGGATHEELERFFEPHGIHVGYDGMLIEL
ncbi:MAG: hypothetical protein D6724_09420 [Armatimonadetes bacterium]|nr:MAG: hypothetical protein D6724_09420 [Armatimonadota bacterium]